jgi:hypothetical protein
MISFLASSAFFPARFYKPACTALTDTVISFCFSSPLRLSVSSSLLFFSPASFIRPLLFLPLFFIFYLFANLDYVIGRWVCKLLDCPWSFQAGNTHHRVWQEARVGYGPGQGWKANALSYLGLCVSPFVLLFSLFFISRLFTSFLLSYILYFWSLSQPAMGNSSSLIDSSFFFLSKFQIPNSIMNTEAEALRSDMSAL